MKEKASKVSVGLLVLVMVFSFSIPVIDGVRTKIELDCNVLSSIPDTITDDSVNDTFTLTVNNTQPVADAGDDQTVDITDYVLFDASSSYDIDGTITEYMWDFGDGQTGDGITTRHKYELPGTYDVTLAITDNLGAKDIDLLIVTLLIVEIDLSIEESDIFLSSFSIIDQPSRIDTIVHCNDPNGQGVKIGEEWESISSLPIADAGFTHVYNEMIYFVGGKSVQTFDPITETWTVIKNKGIGYQPYRGGSVILGDRIYIIHGWTGAPNWHGCMYYDISTNEFGDLPHTNVDRLDVAVGEINGKIYVSGGWSGTSTSVNTVEVYDPNTNTWSLVAPMQVSRNHHEMIAVKGYIYAVGGADDSGGNNYTKTMERYDPRTNTWTLLSSAPYYYQEVSLISDGDSILVVTSNSALYDIGSDTWTTVPKISAHGDGYGYYANAAVLHDGYAYSIGGRTAPNNWYDDVFRIPFGGSGSSATCTVSIYINDVLDISLIDRHFDVFVPSNGQTTLSTTWVPQEEGRHEIIVVISDSVPSEFNLINNTARVTILTRSLQELEHNIEYEVTYLDFEDETVVDEQGIHFHTSVYPDLYHLVPFNDTYWLPEEDIGTYPLYHKLVPVHFRITLWNNDENIAINNIKVQTIQEYHNDVVLWDMYGRVQLHKGQWKDGDSITTWFVDTLEADSFVILEGFYWIEGRGWGLDQTHLTISIGDNIVIDDSEAGVYCPP